MGTEGASGPERKESKECLHLGRDYFMSFLFHGIFHMGI